jgi:hypothetical protein
MKMITDFISTNSDSIEIAVWKLYDIVSKTNGISVKVSDNISQKLIREELDIVLAEIKESNEYSCNIILYNRSTGKCSKIYMEQSAVKKFFAMSIKFDGGEDDCLPGDRYFYRSRFEYYYGNNVKLSDLV